MTESNYVNHLIFYIQSSLSPDLLRGQWRRKNNNTLKGHCYVATETLYYLLGDKSSGYKPCLLTHTLWPEGLKPGETHWFLRKGNKILDPTAAQFTLVPTYSNGRGCGFLTKGPSKRTKTVIDRIVKNVNKKVGLKIRI